jgi:uncharacterized membrane protein
MPSTVFLKNRASSNGTVTGAVLDANGKPVARALVTLKGLGAARTNSRGEYEFVNVPAGTHQLTVVQSGLAPRTTPVQVMARQRSTAKIQFAARDEMPKAVTRAAMVVPGSSTLLRGTVVDHENRRIAGARVSAIQESSAVAVMTGPAGTFELRNLKAGPYHIVVSKVGYESAEKDVALRAAATETRDFQLKKQSATVVMAPSPTRPLVAVRPGGITGQVIDAKTHRPLAGVMIAVSGQRSFSSDAAGRLAIANLPPGTYQVSATKAGYSSDQRTVVVRSGETASLSFSLTPHTVIIKRR